MVCCISTILHRNQLVVNFVDFFVAAVSYHIREAYIPILLSRRREIGTLLLGEWNRYRVFSKTDFQGFVNSVTLLEKLDDRLFIRMLISEAPWIGRRCDQAHCFWMQNRATDANSCFNISLRNDGQANFGAAYFLFNRVRGGGDDWWIYHYTLCILESVSHCLHCEKNALLAFVSNYLTKYGQLQQQYRICLKISSTS